MDPTTDMLIQYGALGFMVLGAAVAIRVLYSRLTAMCERERERADRLEAEVHRLNVVIEHMATHLDIPNMEGL